MYEDYHSYLPMSQAIFWEILTSICQIKSKQRRSPYSREFDRFYFFSDVKTKGNVTQIPQSACSPVAISAEISRQASFTHRRTRFLVGAFFLPDEVYSNGLLIIHVKYFLWMLNGLFKHLWPSIRKHVLSIMAIWVKPGFKRVSKGF